MMRLFFKDVNSILILIAFVFTIMNATFVSVLFPFGNYLVVGSFFLLFVLNLRKATLDFNSLLFLIPISSLIFLSVAVSDNLHLGGYNTALFMLMLLALFFFKDVQFNNPLINSLLIFFSFLILLASYYSSYSGVLSLFNVDPRSGVFLNSNSLGEFVVFLLMYLFLFVKKRKTQVLVFLTAFPLLLISNSRGALFTLLIFIVLFVVSRSRSIDDLILKFITFIFLIVLFLTGIYQLFPESIDALLSKILNSGTTGRVDLWIYAINGILSDEVRFLFGTGPATTIIDGKSIHNSYLNEASNMGVLFVLFYVALILYKCWYSFVYKKTAYMLVVFPILFLGMFESMLFTNSLLWVLMVFALIKQGDSEILSVDV